MRAKASIDREGSRFPGLQFSFSRFWLRFIIDGVFPRLVFAGKKRGLAPAPKWSTHCPTGCYPRIS